MILGDESGMMLKFVQSRNQPSRTTGATIQIAVIDVNEAIAAATAAHALIKIEATDYADSGVRMAVVTTNQGVDIELDQSL